MKQIYFVGYIDEDVENNNKIVTLESLDESRIYSEDAFDTITLSINTKITEGDYVYVENGVIIGNANNDPEVLKILKDNEDVMEKLQSRSI